MENTYREDLETLARLRAGLESNDFETAEEINAANAEIREIEARRGKKATP